MNTSPLHLAVRQLLTHLHGYSRIYLAYSGGLDSSVLLHVLHDLTEIEVRALHVHHGLSPNADAWATHCRQVCENLAVPLEVVRVSVVAQADVGVEAAARQARYAALADRVPPGDVLMTAQHADDQAETVLLQLLRGAGVDGLAAMAALSPFAAGAWLARPWLALRRAEIHTYARQRGITWVEDESNQAQRFSRNFVRHTVIPALQQHWPEAVAILNRAAGQQAESANLLAELAEQDLAGVCCAGVARTYTTQTPADDKTLVRFTALQIAAYNNLSEARRRNALRLWIRRQGARPPPAAQLAEFVRQLAVAGRGELVWRDGALYCYRDLLYCLSRQVAATAGNLPADAILMPWQADTATSVSARVYAYRANGGLMPALEHLTLRHRQGGESLFWRGHRHSIKKCWQDAGIPPWLRGQLPLLYHDEQLVAAVGIGCDPRYQVDENEVGWHFAWQM